METSTTGAERLARALLERSLPRRWAHVQGVAARDTSTLVSGFGWGGPLARTPALHRAVR